MQHQDGYFKSVRDTSIYYQSWLPEDEIKAALLVVHGVAEHSSRYMNLVNNLVPSGFAVFGLDHIGHGKSAGKRVYVQNFKDYTEPLKTYFNMIKKWQPEKPIFLIGHSMGGLISARYLLEHQDEIAGAVLSGPSIKVPDNISKAVIFAGNLLSAVMPWAGIVKLEADGISRDPAVVKDYVNDPLVCTGKITARLGAQLIRTMQNITLNASTITLPIMIVQGGKDRLVDPGGAQLLYDSAGSEDKTLKIYDTLFHEVFNEPEHDLVLNDVKTWLLKHV